MSEDDPAEERSDGAGDDGAAETDGTAADDEAVDAGEESDTETDEVESETEEPVDESATDGADSERGESGDEGGSEPTEESDGDVDPHEVVDVSPDIEDATTDADEETAPAPTVTAEDLNARLDEAEAELEDAETESDLDGVDETLDGIEADLESATLAGPDEDDDGEDDEDAEEAADPREEIEARLSDLRDGVEEKRGPYAEEVVTDVETAQETLRGTRWTERGLTELAGPVDSFLGDVNEVLGTDLRQTGSDPDGLAADLGGAIEAVESRNLDPDDDADTVASLLEATDALRSGLDGAQEWDDLETHEKLQAEGYYDCLGHYKDFPPEWAAMKEWERRGNVEMVLLALDSLQSEFMERHAMDALIRMNDREAFEEMHQRAGKRDKPAIRALGTMAADDEEAVETLVEYVDADSDPALQKETFRALGRIGHPDAVQPLANKLVMDDDNVRPIAARALGLIGDARAVDPLADALEDAESANVRAAAAWALRQIGTEEALERAAAAADDAAFIVQAEADKADDALTPDDEAEATP